MCITAVLSGEREGALSFAGSDINGSDRAHFRFVVCRSGACKSGRGMRDDYCLRFIELIVRALLAWWFAPRLHPAAARRLPETRDLCFSMACGERAAQQSQEGNWIAKLPVMSLRVSATELCSCVVPRWWRYSIDVFLTRGAHRWSERTKAAI